MLGSRRDGAAMPKGTVKWFSAEKGYGFIKPDTPDGTKVKDIFVHHTGVEGEHGAGEQNLIEGQRVEYEIGATGKGPAAVRVRVIE